MRRRTSGVAALLCAAGALAAGAGSASAATTNPFGCTASTAVATLGSTNLLPGATSANAQDTPCASDQELLTATTINPAGLGLVSATVGPASATTTLAPWSRSKCRITAEPMKPHPPVSNTRILSSVSGQPCYQDGSNLPSTYRKGNI